MRKLIDQYAADLVYNRPYWNVNASDKPCLPARSSVYNRPYWNVNLNVPKQPASILVRL